MSELKGVDHLSIKASFDNTPPQELIWRSQTKKQAPPKEPERSPKRA